MWRGPLVAQTSSVICEDTVTFLSLSMDSKIPTVSKILLFIQLVHTGHMRSCWAEINIFISTQQLSR